MLQLIQHTLRPAQHKKIKTIENLLFAFFVIGFLTINQISAAELKLHSNSQYNKVGDQLEVRVLINSQGESINAIEGKVIIPVEVMNVKEIRDGNSIMSLWIDNPKVQNGNEIYFSGIIPGGFIGEDGVIFSLILEVNGVGSNEVRLSQVKLLKNDGSGSEAAVSLKDFQFTTSEFQQNELPKRVAEVEDTEPPESFIPKITNNENVYEGKNYLVFSTLDKISGIYRYEVKEGDGNFEIAQSPYLLKNQTLNKNIEVKVIDKAGNERKETIYLNSENVQVKIINPTVYLAPILAILLLFSIFIAWKKPWLKR